MLYKILLALIAIIVLWTAFSYFFERNIEQPSYTVLEERDGYEIRKYDPYLVAQVELSNLPYREALNEGFNILAGYIFGNNVQKEEFAMTAPVFVGEAEMLAMNAPVFVSPQTMSFVMPSEYTLETLPTPQDKRISFVEVPERTVAALTFSWWRIEERVLNKEDLLKRYLMRDDIAITGKTEYAGYNAPFTAPWLNRNEILIEI